MFRRILPLLVLLATSANAQQKPVHTKVDLLSEDVFLQPGHAFTLGVRFRMEPGWHIYWLNPGDSGQGPSVQWHMDGEFSAAPLQWPAPQRLVDGPLIDFGYTDQVLLLALLTPSKKLTLGSKAGIAADVKWLECEKVCIPQKTHLEVHLPVLAAASSTNPAVQNMDMKDIFTHTRAALPVALPKHWSVSAATLKDTFLLTVRMPVTARKNAKADGKSAIQTFFFPLETNLIENTAPQKITYNDGGFTMELRKSDQYLRPADVLPGVLSIGGNAYTVHARLR